MELTLRDAEPDDYDDVVAFTSETWGDRDVGDYLPAVYPEWIRGDDKRTVVAEAAEGDVVSIAQAVLLSDYEAWVQGMRTAPAARGQGVGSLVVSELLDWARDQGARVARNMVFSWNEAGLGQSRATGFRPTTEFRWAHPDPDADADPSAAAVGASVASDPDAAWAFWRESAACRQLGGLALCRDESWALRDLTRADLTTAADETALLAIRRDGTEALAFRTRTAEREGDDGETETLAEYGVGAWATVDAARGLFAAIARDAASVGADETRVLIPETPRAVSDAAFCRVALADHPDFVLSADLTRE